MGTLEQSRAESKHLPVSPEVGSTRLQVSRPGQRSGGLERVARSRSQSSAVGTGCLLWFKVTAVSRSVRSPRCSTERGRGAFPLPSSVSKLPGALPISAAVSGSRWSGLCHSRMKANTLEAGEGPTRHGAASTRAKLGSTGQERRGPSWGRQPAEFSFRGSGGEPPVQCEGKWVLGYKGPGEKETIKEMGSSPWPAVCGGPSYS